MRWRMRGRRGPGDGSNVELDARLSETWDAAAAAVGTMLDLPAGKEALLASSGLLPEGTADLPAPTGTTRVARARRRQLALRSAAAVAAALAAAAVALAAIRVPATRLHGTGPVVDAAYVVKRVDSALSAAGPAAIGQMMVTVRGALPSGGATTAEEWSYGGRWRAVTYSPAGHPVYDEGSSASSVCTVVSYQARTWARQYGPGLPAPPVSGRRGCGPLATAGPKLIPPGLAGIGFPTRPLPANVAGVLRTAVSCGTLTLAGRQRIDGIEAIELTSRPESLISETVWVSPGTYLPVRVVVRSAAGTPVLRQTADITWFKPTAQNLARLTVPVPAGFRQVSLARILQQILGGPLKKSG
jgi:hypothetical protein